MEIRWFGQSFFEVTTSTKAKKEIRIFFDPYDPKIGIEPPTDLEADIVFTSHRHHDHNNTGLFKEIDLLIKNAGEYSVKGLDIKGIASFHDNNGGKDKGANVIYTLEAEKIKLVHLGDLGHLLTDEQLKKIDGVDILFLPVGGPSSISGKEAVRVAKQIEPKIIIPMHYKIPGINFEMKELEDFLKEMGVGEIEPVRKLSLKLSLIENKEMEVVIMERIDRKSVV